MKNGSLDDTYYVNLMVNLLVRFPEIFTINYNVANFSCSFSYMIRKTLKGEEYRELCRYLDQSVQALRYFQKKEPVRMRVRKKNIGALTHLEISFAATPPATEEISLVTSLLRESFIESLVAEFRPDEAEWDEGENTWEEYLGFMMARGERKEENLFAFREAGKVYVFDK